MKNLLTEEQIQNFVVQHFSASSIRTYLTDRQGFKKRYILLEFEDFKPSPALIEGKIFHAVLERFWINYRDNPKKEFNSKQEVDEIILRYTQEGEFDKIDYGKTGSYEKSIGVINNLVEFYFENLDKLFDLKNTKILSIEEKMLSNIEDFENNLLPIPLKGFCDLIYENKKGEIIIIDHKTVTSFITQEDFIASMNISEEECKDLGLHDPVYELQAASYWFLVRKLYGKNPTKMEFHQVKKSKNRDGSNQIHKYTVDFNVKMIKRFLEIYIRIIKELTGQSLIDESTGILQFLPNPFQQFGWTDSWLDFCREVNGESLNFSELKILKNKIQVEQVDVLDL